MGDATFVGRQHALLSSTQSVISTYALCGFANFASIGIQIGAAGVGVAESGAGPLVRGERKCRTQRFVAGAAQTLR